MRQKISSKTLIWITGLTLLVAGSCATPKMDQQAPIENPFGTYYGQPRDSRQNVVLRSRRGDRAFELELPELNSGVESLVIPVNPSLGGGASFTGRSPAGTLAGGGYTAPSGPSYSDREIAARFSRYNVDGGLEQADIEDGLGLTPKNGGVPDQDSSYLVAMDGVKELYKQNRFEAAIMQLDQMLKAYPTDPKIFAMRGTLLERLGYPDLALKSWIQALEFEPANESLRKLIERKKQNQSRRVASP